MFFKKFIDKAASAIKSFDSIPEFQDEIIDNIPNEDKNKTPNFALPRKEALPSAPPLPEEERRLYPQLVEGPSQVDRRDTQSTLTNTNQQAGASPKNEMKTSDLEQITEGVQKINLEGAPSGKTASQQTGALSNNKLEASDIERITARVQKINLEGASSRKTADQQKRGLAGQLDTENSPSHLAERMVRMLKTKQKLSNKSDEPTVILSILSQNTANKTIKDILLKLAEVSKSGSELKIDEKLISEVHEACMEQLIQSPERADINAPDGEEGDARYGPLHYAAMSDNVLVMRVLLKHKADLKLTDHCGRTALELAYMNVSEKCKVELINATMKDPELINKPHRPKKYINRPNSDTLLHEAADDNNVDLIIRLLQHGADPQVRNDKGETPLHCACAPEVVQALLAGGADHQVRNHQGDTPLHCAYRSGVIQELLRQGANPNAQNQAGDTLLHKIIRINRETALELVKLLLDWGADVTIPNRTGETPVTIAREKGNQEIINILEKNIKEKSSFRTAQVYGRQAIGQSNSSMKNAGIIQIDLTQG